MPRLIVNADDFGLTSGVNRAILELHRAGVLTSATLMARAEATDEAIDIARATPSLGVGCHIVLVDGEPLLSGLYEMPNVAVPPFGRFAPTLLQFLSTIYLPDRRSWFGASNAEKVDRQIEMEARAQIQSLLSRGVHLTHVDTHKHTHMFPRVLHPVLRAARACGIGAVRNPFEPPWSIHATPGAPIVRRTQVRLLRLLASNFHRIVAEAGFATTSGALGVLATGTLDAPTITSLLGAIPVSESKSTFELVTHPGYSDASLAQVNTRLLASREAERAALDVLRSIPNLDLLDFASIRPAPEIST